MNQPLTDPTAALWQRLVDTHEAASQACRDFLAEKAGRLDALRKALRGPERDTALWVSRSLMASTQPVNVSMHGLCLKARKMLLF